MALSGLDIYKLLPKTALSALERYGTFTTQYQTLANPYITKDGFANAVSYLVASQGISEQTAFYALENIAKIRNLKIT